MKRRFKKEKIAKKKETVTLRCGLIRKNTNFQGFRFPIPKIENSEISESFLLFNFLVAYETQNLKTD